MDAWLAEQRHKVDFACTRLDRYDARTENRMNRARQSANANKRSRGRIQEKIECQFLPSSRVSIRATCWKTPTSHFGMRLKLPRGGSFTPRPAKRRAWRETCCGATSHSIFRWCADVS